MSLIRGCRQRDNQTLVLQESQVNTDKQMLSFTVRDIYKGTECVSEMTSNLTDVCVIVLQLTCMYYYIKSAGLNAFSQYPPEVLIYYKYVSRIICAHGGVHEDRLLTQLSVCLFVLQLRSD